MAPSVEVDLTAATPPKKMKQARLPFAPVQNKSVKKDAVESGRKRKHSEEEVVTPNKNPKKDAKSPVKSIKKKKETKVEVSKEEHDQENNPEITSGKSVEESVAKSPKKASTEANVTAPELFKGLLKMPFKKSKKKGAKEVKAGNDDDVDLDVSLDTSVDTSAVETPAEESSMTSMTDEWAKFHENGEVADNSMEEVETSHTEEVKTPKSSKKKSKEEKEKEKEEKLKQKSEEKVRKEEEKAKAKAEKEKRKSLLKEEKEKSKDKAKKEKTPKKGKIVVDKSEVEDVVANTKTEGKDDTPSKEKGTKSKENTPAKAKANPLAKFLVKSKVVNKEPTQSGDKKLPKDKDGVQVVEDESKETTEVGTCKDTHDDDDDIQVVEEVKADKPSSAPATSTPLRTSPRKKVSLGKTPSTPFTPDPDRAKRLSIAKLKVKISELNMVMDRAVEDKDFLKAHESKQAIQKLEEEIKDIDADTSYVSQSFSDMSGAASTESTPKVTPKATPKNSRNVSVVSTPGSAAGTPTLFKKLTPGQLAKQEDMKKKREALEQEKRSKKETLEKEKLAKKEALEKEKQAKKEALEKEKADKERQKEVEKRAKEVERLEKERARKAEKEKQEAEKEKAKQEKEEERLRKKAEKDAEMKLKDEEKLKKEEAEKEKIKKKAEAFKSFFKKDDVAKERKISDKEVEEVAEGALGNFTLFRVKNNMRLAPTVRNDPEMAKKRIDSLDMPSGPDGMYLALLKTNYKPGKQSRTWPYEKNMPKEDDEVEILEDEEEEESDPEDLTEESNEKIILNDAKADMKIPKAKLLQFHANQRPAYWGTWTKKSQFVSGRRPFGKDEERFEYDYDSDEDWEEEEEGESLSDNEDDKEKEEEKDDYEVDNEFFVPHGYLSDEEEEKDEDEVFNPETAKEKAKEKLKHAEKEFEKEHKKKTQQLKPRLWGVCFEGDTLDTEAAASQLVKILGGFKGMLAGNNNCIETGFSKTVTTPTAMRDEATDSASIQKSGKGGAKVRSVPEEAVPHLIKLLHGNNNNKMFLAREFIEFWKKSSEEGTSEAKDDEEASTPGGKGGSQFTISKRKMIDKIQEIADYRRLTEGGVKCWWVKEDVLSKYEIVPAATNDWSYILEQPNCKNLCTDSEIASRPGSPSTRAAVAPNPASLITKFARVLTEEEKEEQKAKQEREALLARLKREAAKADQAAKDAKVKAEQAAVVPPSDAAAAVPGAKTPLGGGMTKFTKVLSSEEHKARLASPVTAGKKRVALTPVTQASPVAVKRANSNPLSAMSASAGTKRAALTPVATAGKKKNPIAALVADKELTSPKVASPATAVKKTAANPILTKKAPGSTTSPAPSRKGLKISTPDAINAKASPIAIRRKPKATATLSFEGKLGTPTSLKNLPGVSVTPVRSSPRKKKVVECVTLD